MIQRIKKNQSGAALMIVLILVVLVSIVGTAMLSTTTYGLQNVVKTTKEQEEFYRAEGALEIVLAEMASYKDPDTGDSGPYAYLKKMTVDTKIYPIGEEDIQVKIVKKEINTKKINVNIEARYANENQSKLSRVLNFDVDVNYNPLPRTKTAYGYVEEGHYKDKGQFKEGIMDNIIKINYDDIIEKLKINWGNYTGVINNQSLKADGTYTFPTNATYPPGKITTLKEINITGSGNKVIIPQGAIVYVQTVTIGGNGNDDTQLLVEGALIAETISHKGNSVLTLNSGLIAKEFNGVSNQYTVKGNGDGIDCNLLPEVCVAINGSETTDKFISTPNSSSINFSTNR